MKGDKYLSFVILFQMIVVTIQSLLPLTGLFSVDQASIIRIIVTLATCLPGIVIVFMRKPRPLIIVFFLYFLILLFNYFLFPASHTFIESTYAFTLTPISILTALFMVCIWDFEAFTQMLLYISRASVIIALLYVVAYNISPFRDLDDTYSMSFGYSMLLPTMFLFTQESIKDKLFSFTLFILILLCASRGPLVVIAVFYMINIFLYTSARAKISIFIVLMIVGLTAVYILPNYVDFESSRTLSLFESGELISHDSGREEGLYSILSPIIMERPLCGWGIGADRFFLDGAYSHNVFYELSVHYGIIGGGVILLIFFVWCSRLFFSTQIQSQASEKQMFTMMFLYGFVPLLVSGSYLIESFFALMMGYFFRLGSYKEDDIPVECEI
jgi:hypothetical protein